MSRTVTLARNTYTPGVRSFVSTPVPVNLAQIGIELARVNWPTNAEVSFTLDLSLDDGATWIAPFIAFTTSGSVDGTASTLSRMVIDLPDTGSTERRMRGSVSLVNASIETDATVELT